MEWEETSARLNVSKYYEMFRRLMDLPDCVARRVKIFSLITNFLSVVRRAPEEELFESTKHIFLTFKLAISKIKISKMAIPKMANDVTSAGFYNNLIALKTCAIPATINRCNRKKII